MIPEDVLIQKALKKDEDALSELLKRYYPKVLSYCLWHTVSRQDAEDAAQETLIKTFRHIQRSGDCSHFRSFIYQVARNTCIDLTRKQTGRFVSLDAFDWEIPSLSYEDHPDNEDEPLVRYTASLPEELREVILLRFGQDLTLREIARITDVPLRTAQSRLNRALKKLRKEWKNDADSI